MKTRTILLYLILLSVNVSSYAQDRQLNLYIEDIKYDSIALSMLMPDQTMRLIDGHTTDSVKWIFEIPDVVFLNYLSANFRCKQTLDTASINPGMLFTCDYDQSSGSLLFDNKKVINLYATFEDVYKKDTDSGTGYYHLFMIEDESSPEICRSILFLNEYFNWAKNDIPHDEAMKNWLELINEYPGSYTLYKVVKLLRKQVKYFTMDDFQQFYATFATTVRNPREWEDVLNYMKEPKKLAFSNMDMEDCMTGEMVPIIVNPKKDNLIIFSASDCEICHKLIPLYKEIHKEFKNSLEIVYVSLDEEDAKDAWKKLIKREQIPWRSLVTGAKSKEVIQKYGIKGIPFALLITPSGESTIFDPRINDLSYLGSAE
ncbi:MAG: thioredoxin family protein [Prevotella sp.]|jgi:thiol-disulfide isomerase/thioredoxin|nr:thioredoxin family protein [Prevotella sp.]